MCHAMAAITSRITPIAVITEYPNSLGGVFLTSLTALRAASLGWTRGLEFCALAGVISCCSNSGLGASVSVSDGATWTSLSGGNSETSEKLGPRPVAWPSSIIGSVRNAGAAVSTSSTAERIDCERGLAELSHPAAATAAFALVSGPVIISDGTAWGVLAEHAAGF